MTLGDDEIFIQQYLNYIISSCIFNVINISILDIWGCNP